MKINEYLSENKSNEFNLEYSQKESNYFEYKKVINKTFPLIHIVIPKHNWFSREKIPTAIGAFAIGKKAVGGITIGISTLGIIGVGIFNIGIISFGLLSLALLFSLGCVSLGGVSVGNLAFGILSLGNIAFGYATLGNMAYGNYAVANVASGKNYISLGNNPTINQIINALNHIVLDSDSKLADIYYNTLKTIFSSSLLQILIYLTIFIFFLFIVYYISKNIKKRII